MSAPAHAARRTEALSSLVLVVVPRSERSYVEVKLDKWENRAHSIKLSAFRPSQRTGEVAPRRSITLYPAELKRVILALAKAYRLLGMEP